MDAGIPKTESPESRERLLRKLTSAIHNALVLTGFDLAAALNHPAHRDRARMAEMHFVDPAGHLAAQLLGFFGGLYQVCAGDKCSAHPTEIYEFAADYWVKQLLAGVTQIDNDVAYAAFCQAQRVNRDLAQREEALSQPPPSDPHILPNVALLDHYLDVFLDGASTHTVDSASRRYGTGRVALLLQIINVVRDVYARNDIKDLPRSHMVQLVTQIFNEVMHPGPNAPQGNGALNLSQERLLSFATIGAFNPPFVMSMEGHPPPETVLPPTPTYTPRLGPPRYVMDLPPAPEQKPTSSEFAEVISLLKELVELAKRAEARSNPVNWQWLGNPP